LRSIVRLVWCCVHVVWSLGALVVLCFRRRRAVCVFTHAPDVDADGLDRQLGPLVDRLRADGTPCVEITFVALSRDFLRCVGRRRGAFLSYVLIAGPAWLWALPAADRRATRRAAGARVASLLFRLLRPRAVVLTDESGSGQPLLRAARRRGIPVVGVQHGDFQPDNPQYAQATDVEPADTLCVWSPWFRERLLRISPIYTPERVAVTGRLRYPAPPPSERDGRELHVLLLSEASADFPGEVHDALRVLEGDPGIAVSIQPHPGEDPGRWSGSVVRTSSLVTALQDCDVALGVGSSALLEALYHRRPAITLVTRERRDPSGYAGEELVATCEDAGELAALCRALAGPESRAELEARRSRVWGEDEPDPVDPVEAVLALCLPEDRHA